jgi:non-ribosomal peptide synthetase component F
MRIDRLVTDVAARAPRRIAVQGARESMTYGELDLLANRFANFFLLLGVQPGDRVGVHVPRSGIAIAAMLGASRAQAIYVPLDPSSPPARMQIVATDCGLRHVVITPGLLANWAAAGVIVPHFIVAGDEDLPPLQDSCQAHAWSEVQAANDAAPERSRTSPDDLAYLLYTSGSTGVPKGVMISHRNALAFVDWAADAAQLVEQDRVASVAPFHFDLSVFDIWATLSRGATLVIVDEATVLSGRRMVERIAEQNITVWYSVPSALILMLESGELALRGAPSLRVVFFAGEVFPIRHLRRLMNALPKARFLNLFGPTETNVCLAYEMPDMFRPRMRPPFPSGAPPVATWSPSSTRPAFPFPMEASANCWWTAPPSCWATGMRATPSWHPTLTRRETSWNGGQMAKSCITGAATTWSKCAGFVLNSAR